MQRGGCFHEHDSSVVQERLTGEKKVIIDNNSLAHTKGVEIIEEEVCSDPLVSIPPQMSVSGVMGYLKGKSVLLIFQKYGNMRFAWSILQIR